MTKIKLTYTESIAELETILADLENNDNINLENIAEKVKRATFLMDYCKKQLHVLDEELEKMILELEN
jgi:exodeoxyribonuclease VII small subunit